MEIEEKIKFGDRVLVDGTKSGQMIDIVGGIYQIDINGKWELFAKERVKKDPKYANI